jgi:hypothetical protein
LTVVGVTTAQARLEISLPESLVRDTKSWLETFDGDTESQAIRDLVEKTRRHLDEDDATHFITTVEV